MAKVCPRCGGTQVGCPVCGLPPKRVLPKQTVFNRLYGALFGEKYWEVQGIDVSKWNGQVNFAITRTKCQFVIMRMGYGSQWKDGNVDTYYANARANDMPVGFYWYARPEEDPVMTADSFAEEVATHPVQLDLHLDLERSTLTPSQNLEWIIACENRLKSKTNKLQVPYSAKYFWDASVARSSAWITRTVWPANWVVRDYPVVPIDWTFKQGDFWQHSADGNKKALEYGSTGGDPDMDLDRYNGTCGEFNAKYGTHIKAIGAVVPPIPPPVPGTLPEYVIINGVGELAIHSTPVAVTTNIIGHALNNSKWYPYELVYGGGIEWYRVGKNAYISKKYTRLP